MCTSMYFEWNQQKFAYISYRYMGNVSAVFWRITSEWNYTKITLRVGLELLKCFGSDILSPRRTWKPYTDFWTPFKCFVHEHWTAAQTVCYCAENHEWSELWISYALPNLQRWEFYTTFLILKTRMFFTYTLNRRAI